MPSYWRDHAITVMGVKRSVEAELERRAEHDARARSR